jgi:hypothetical protein
MSTLALGLLIIFAIATAMFYAASGLYGHGSPWASDVCSLSRDLCDQPVWAAVATAIMTLVYLGLRSAKL